MEDRQAPNVEYFPNIIPLFLIHLYFSIHWIHTHVCICVGTCRYDVCILISKNINEVYCFRKLFRQQTHFLSDCIPPNSPIKINHVIIMIILHWISSKNLLFLIKKYIVLFILALDTYVTSNCCIMQQ